MTDEEIIEHGSRRPPRRWIVVAVFVVLVAGVIVVTTRHRSQGQSASGISSQDTITHSEGAMCSSSGCATGEVDCSPGGCSSPSLVSSPSPSRFTGAGPYVLFATEDAGVPLEVFAIDLSTVHGGLPAAEFVGTFPGRLNPNAGGQGQVAGTKVPLLAVEPTADASAVTRLFLIDRRGSERIVSTFDFVSGYAINSKADQIAVSRRSNSSALRGAFLWLYQPRPLLAGKLIGPLRRPGGNSGRDSLRPRAWDGSRIIEIPFCDSCDQDAIGLFSFDAATSKTTSFPVQSDLPFDATSSADGSKIAFDAVRDLAGKTEQSLTVLDTRSGAVRVVARSTTTRFNDLRIAPDGGSVAYSSGSTGTIDVLSLVDHTTVSYPGFGGPGLPAGWLPDGRLLLLQGAQRGANVILSVATEGAVQTLAEHAGLTYLGWLR